MRRTTDFYEIQVPYKFESIEACNKKISALIEFIRYHAKEKGYFCQGIIVASEIKIENILSVRKEDTSKRGRPKLVKVIEKYKIGQLETDGPGHLHFVKKEESEIKEIKVRPHIHILLLLNPSATFAELIRVYIQKNWEKDSVIENSEVSVYKDNEDKNIRVSEYFIKQASTVRFINENHSEDLKDFPSEVYNFRNYHSAYLDVQSYIWDHKQISDRKGDGE